MRGMTIALGLLLVAGCVAGGGQTMGIYDPRLYDANGNVVAAAPPPPPPPVPDCREVERSVIIGGQAQRATGTACRQPDGTWRFTD